MTQLFGAEAQAKKADKKEAQATAALLVNVQAQRESTILGASTKATIDALIVEGFNAARMLRDHVKRWADMISAEYAGDTLRILNANSTTMGCRGTSRSRRCWRCFASSSKIPSIGSMLQSSPQI